MKKLIGLIATLLTSTAAVAGISSGTSPWYCGESESHRQVLQEKLIELPPKAGGDFNAPIVLKAQLIKSLVACAGAYGTATLQSRLRVEVTPSNPNLSGYQVQDILGEGVIAKSTAVLRLNEKMLAEKPLLQLSYSGKYTRIMAESKIEGTMDQLHTARTKKFFSFEADLGENMEQLASYFIDLRISVQGLPEIYFTHGAL